MQAMKLQSENHNVSSLKTLVYQSFRTEGIPVWMATCMKSVKDWADHKNYAYEFLDDSFFGYAPAWFREATNNQRHLVADFARLELANLYLNKGWDRVIWVDADVFICDIECFEIDERSDFLLCRELWVTRRDAQVVCSKRVNNSVMMFAKGNDFLHFYRLACQKIVMAKKHECKHTEIGTGFLSGIPRDLPLLKTVACLSPFLLSVFAHKRYEIIEAYEQEFYDPVLAVNLCLTFRDWQYDGVILSDEVYLAVIDYFKKSRNP
ncbi:MAG: hypothetical protein B0W54_04685 [Cellvibrio sp. 79]|nr:MAG: hypothetical protein B0W54_04685 [Cellvibrio sp. 79]